MVFGFEFAGLKVAAKAVNLEDGTESQDIKKCIAELQREAVMLSALFHPNIVSLLGLSYYKSTTYLVLEEAVSTLEQHLNDRGKSVASTYFDR